MLLLDRSSARRIVRRRVDHRRLGASPDPRSASVVDPPPSRLMRVPARRNRATSSSATSPTAIPSLPPRPVDREQRQGAGRPRDRPMAAARRRPASRVRDRPDADFDVLRRVVDDSGARSHYGEAFSTSVTEICDVHAIVALDLHEHDESRWTIMRVGCRRIDVDVPGASRDQRVRPVRGDSNARIATRPSEAAMPIDASVDWRPWHGNGRK